ERVAGGLGQMNVSIEKQRRQESASTPDAPGQARAAQDLEVDLLIPVKSRTRVLLETWLPPVIALLLLIVVWAALIRWKHTPPLVAPSPGDVLNGIRYNASDLLTALRSTFVDSFLGLVLSIVVGVGLAVIMSQSKLLERAIFPYTT